MSKTDGIFITKRVHVELPDYRTPIYIQPFGDVLRHAPHCAVEKWKAFLEWAKGEHTEHTYYLGAGDYDDLASTSERAILNDSRIHESTRHSIDSWALGKCNDLCGELDFMRGNLLGLIEGNHHWEFEDGETSTQKMCGNLGCEWLGNLAYIRLHCSVKGVRNAHTHVDIVIAHGKAGGKLVGTRINQVADLRAIFPLADIYLMGHDHHKGGLPTSVLFMPQNGGTIKQKRQWMGRTGSFLRGYIENNQSYVVKRLYSPTDIGVIRFRVDCRRDRTDGGDAMITDIHMWS